MKIKDRRKKSKNKTAKIIAISVICVLAILIFSAGSFVVFCISTSKPDPENGKSVSYRMKDDFSVGNVKLVDISMLGAHNAFANNIDENCVIDPIETNLSSKIPALRFLNDGLYNAQKAYPYELLDYGVRYFDIRLSRHEGSWHVKHAFIADDVNTYIEDILRFLSENTGEVVLLDFQHVYYAESTFSALASYILNVGFEGKTLADYAVTSSNDISSLTYKDATENGTKNAVIMFIKPYEDKPLGSYFFDRETNIRSKYHAVMSVKDTVKGIKEEYEFLKNNPVNSFIVMQAIPRITFGFDGFSLNLNNKATKDNIEYINNPDFKEWLTNTPVFMVNNCLTTAHDFQPKAVKIISDFNKELDRKNAA